MRLLPWGIARAERWRLGRSRRQSARIPKSENSSHTLSLSEAGRRRKYVERSISRDAAGVSEAKSGEATGRTAPRSLAPQIRNCVAGAISLSALQIFRPLFDRRVSL